MSRSLRRSRRAPKAKNSDYNEGDIVEINRSGAVLRGRLAQLLTAGTSPNPRWLVKFDGQPQKDEEMYERAFGKILQVGDDDDPASDRHSPVPTKTEPEELEKAPSPTTTQASNPTGRRGSATGSTKLSSSDGEDAKNGNGSSKEEGTDDDNSSDAEQGGGRRNGRSKSAREQRSRRRQAKIDDDVVPEGGQPGGVRRAAPVFSASNKKQKRDDGDVVKVKLLTGTLYLYRGAGVQRRAEFVRKV